MDERTGLPAQQTCLWVALRAVLPYGVVVCLAARLALHFDGCDSESVDEDHVVDDFAIRRPHLARDGKDVLLPCRRDALLKRRVRKWVNHNRIQAGDLEKIAITLNADIRLFFDVSAVKYDVQCQTEQSAALLQLCKAMVENNQQRDGIMSQLASMVKAMEE